MRASASEIVPNASSERSRKIKKYCMSLSSFFVSFRFCIGTFKCARARVFFRFSASSDDDEEKVFPILRSFRRRRRNDRGRQKTPHYFLSSSVARSRNFSSFDLLEFATMFDFSRAGKRAVVRSLSSLSSGQTCRRRKKTAR